MRLRLLCTLVCLLTLYSTTSVESAYTIKNGRLVDVSQVATMPAIDHYNAGVSAFEACDWKEAIYHFRILTLCFPSTPYGQEAYFFLGIAYYNLEEYDFANESFSSYLNCQGNPNYFEETIQYKFCIADKFSGGAKRRFFGTKHFPKWACGKSMAIDIYDEVIAAVPCNEIAAQALVSKAYLLWTMNDFKGAVDAYSLVIRRFPKHELAPECYLLISQVYLAQAYHDFQNPDILAFSQINLKRFKRDFPREDRVGAVESDVIAIKELFAKGLYETGQFYERTYHRRAAIIYYRNAIHQFPETCIASQCRERLMDLVPDYCAPTDDDEEDCEDPDEDLSGLEDPFVG